MAKVKSNSNKTQLNKKKNSGKHSKKVSSIKTSKNYEKPYAGQGR
jgi:hypothetical protein